MKAINEAVIDLKVLGKGNDNDIVTLSKVRKIGKSKLDDIIEDEDNLDAANPENIIVSHDPNKPQFLAANDIVVPQSVSQIMLSAEQNQLDTSNRVAQMKARLQLKKAKALPVANLQQKRVQEIQMQAVAVQQALPPTQQNIQLVSDYNELTGSELPEDTDLLTLQKQIDEALDEIPESGDARDLSDFDLTEVAPRKDKTGYVKLKVTIKKETIPAEMSKLATVIKTATKGLVKHRVMDLRTIGNTNKTQLRGSELKLTATSINFKPDGGSVNKGTRFIVSIPDDFKDTHNIIVYIQESRDKFIILIEGKTFSNWDAQLEFIAENISKYYQFGFKATKVALQSKDVLNPLMSVVRNVLSTGRFKLNPHADDTGKVDRLTIITKGEKNQWLCVVVTEGSLTSTYKVMCLSKVDTSWKGVDVNNPKGHPLTILDLNGDKFIKVLDTLFDKEWNLITDDNREYYMLNKLTYGKLKEAFIRMWEITETSNDSQLKIAETLSKIDTKKAINDSYEAEGIIGKTKYLDYFILTYLAVAQHGGDKRNPQEYITSDDYHEKYSVGDRRPYSERNATILKKEGEKRNYHSRIYMFQVEYSIGERKCMFKAITFDEILEATGILSETPQAI